MFETLNLLLIDNIIIQALNEDLGTGDITSSNIIDPSIEGTGKMITKEKGVIAGLPLVSRIFQHLNKKISFTPFFEDGDFVLPGQIIAEIKGPLQDILGGERVSLNFLQRLSGIATKTAAYVKLASPYHAKIADTRKTTPGLRILEKYSVRIGGGINHRFGLYDSILIKDNHIQAAGGITKAVKNIRENLSFTVKVEVEVTSLDEFEEALNNKVELIMLDNMSINDIKKAVKKRGNNNVLLEASGNINEENLFSIAATGVDIISSGALTHSVKVLDISFNLI